METKKIMPHEPEAERIVLGAIMSNKNAMNEVRDLLTPDCFYDPFNKSIFQAIIAIESRGESPDMIMVANEMRKTDENVDLFKLSQFAGLYTTDLYQHASILHDKEKRRRFIEIGLSLQSRAYSESDDIVDILADTEESLKGIFQSTKSNISTLKEAIKGVTKQMEMNAQDEKPLTGTPTGFHKIDARCGGLQKSDLIIIAADTSSGKALPMDANILTSNGWVKNRDLRIGQQVCSPNGEDSFITGIFYRGVRPMYRVSFSDGRSVVCCNEHLWEITSCAFKTGNRVMNTEQLKNMQDNTVAYHNKMATPEFSGIWGIHKDFVIHPYLMGVLLGDGSLSRGVEWNKPDLFLLEKIRGMIKEEYSINRVGHSEYRSPSYRITQGKGKENIYLDELKRLGLYGKKSADKFIPEDYLNTSREQRVLLMQGLMDTDGYAGKNGECVFSSKSETLSDGVRYLAHSLGYKATKRKKKSRLYGKDFGFSYDVCINDKNKNELFSLPRKKNRIIPHKRTSNVIRSVEYVGEMECQCISVSHPSELYITDGFIVTHNTSLAIAFTLSAARYGDGVAFYSMEMKKEQIAARMISIESGIPANEIMYSRLGTEQFEAIDNGIGKIYDKPVYFDDRSNSNIDTILASIRTMKLKYGISGAVVDYLQILSVNMKGSNTEQQMGEAARRLKNLAKELDIWIIALSQLNRDSVNPVPSLARLRASGQIAEAADTVMLIYRPELYGKFYPDPFQNANTQGTAMIDLAKGRNVGLMKFLVRFDASTTHFTDMDDMSIPIQEEEQPF